jgi:hypothetical protein
MLLDFLPDVKRVNFVCQLVFFLRYIAVQYVIQVHSPERHVNKRTASRAGVRSADPIADNAYLIACAGDVCEAFA